MKKIIDSQNWNYLFHFRKCLHQIKFQEKMNLLTADQKLLLIVTVLTTIILFNLINNFQAFQSFFSCMNNYKQWQSDFLHKLSVTKNVNHFNLKFNHLVKFLCLTDYIIEIWIWADNIKSNVISYHKFAIILSLIM